MKNPPLKAGGVVGFASTSAIVEAHANPVKGLPVGEKRAMGIVVLTLRERTTISLAQ